MQLVCPTTLIEKKRKLFLQGNAHIWSYTCKISHMMNTQIHPHHHSSTCVSMSVFSMHPFTKKVKNKSGKSASISLQRLMDARRIHIAVKNVNTQMAKNISKTNFFSHDFHDRCRSNYVERMDLSMNAANAWMKIEGDDWCRRLMGGWCVYQAHRAKKKEAKQNVMKNKTKDQKHIKHFNLASVVADAVWACCSSLNYLAFTDFHSHVFVRSIAIHSQLSW